MVYSCMHITDIIFFSVEYSNSQWNLNITNDIHLIQIYDHISK